MLNYVLFMNDFNTFTADDDYTLSYIVGNTQPTTTHGCHKHMDFYFIDKIFGYL